MNQISSTKYTNFFIKYCRYVKNALLGSGNKDNLVKTIEHIKSKHTWENIDVCIRYSNDKLSGSVSIVIYLCTLAR